MAFFRLALCLVSLLLSSTPIGAKNECDELLEARVCDAWKPWKKVSEFPFAHFKEEPLGLAVAFHLDGRGAGVVQGIDMTNYPSLNSFSELPNHWARELLEATETSQIGDVEMLTETIDGYPSKTIKFSFELRGRASFWTGSFVSTEVGYLMIYSVLNRKMSRQAGLYLHRGLVSSVRLQRP